MLRIGANASTPQRPVIPELERLAEVGIAT
jgi:hypothetical protein